MSAPVLPNAGQFRTEEGFGETLYFVSPDSYRGLCVTLKELGFDYPRSLSGTDVGYGLRLTLHLSHLLSGVRVTVITEIQYGAPSLASVTDLWPGVEWHEREAYDLAGITFTGHPDLRRIMLEDDWTIHPLQRRYDTKGYLDPAFVAQPFPDPPIWLAKPEPASVAKPVQAPAPSATPVNRVAAADTKQATAGAALSSADTAKAGWIEVPQGPPTDVSAGADLAAGAAAPLTTSERIVGASALDDEQKVGGLPGELAAGTTTVPGGAPASGTGALTPAGTTGGTGPTTGKGSAPAPAGEFAPDPGRVRKPPKRWEPKTPSGDDGKEKP